MISCPDCQAENETGATMCHSCGKQLPGAAGSEALPPWLQALKPEAMPVAAGGTAKLGEGDLLAEPLPFAWDEGATVAAGATKSGGLDTLVATQPTAEVRPSTSPKVGRAESPAPKLSQQASETASLISEEDLPAWLRAFSETEAASASAGPDDQSWMLGTAGGAAPEVGADALAQSWQAPTRTAAQRTSAAAAFATQGAGTAKVARVTRPEPVAPEPAPVMAARGAAEPAPAAGALPTRLGAHRPVPAARGRGGASVQRVAVIAFLVALIVFLVVLGFFVIKPALMG